jgi:hypothetical protein
MDLPTRAKSEKKQSHVQMMNFNLTSNFRNTLILFVNSLTLTSLPNHFYIFSLSSTAVSSSTVLAREPPFEPDTSSDENDNDNDAFDLELAQEVEVTTAVDEVSAALDDQANFDAKEVAAVMAMLTQGEENVEIGDEDEEADVVDTEDEDELLQDQTSRVTKDATDTELAGARSGETSDHASDAVPKVESADTTAEIVEDQELGPNRNR